MPLTKLPYAERMEKKENSKIEHKLSLIHDESFHTRQTDDVLGRHHFKISAAY